MGKSDPEVIRAVTGLFLALTYITVGLRCYIRAFVIKSFGSEDWFAVASLACFTVFAASTLEGAAKGAGQHMVDLPAEIRAEGLKYWWLVEVSYTATSALLKISVGCMLQHFVVKKPQRIAIWIVMGFVSAYSTTFFFFVIFQCTPPSFFWADQVGETGTCLPQIAVGIFSIAFSIINAMADLFFAIMPCLVVRHLQIPAKQKVYVSGILGIGALAGVAVIIRIPYLIILLDNYLDFLYFSTNGVNWSTVELGLGITASALATLRPLFRTMMSKSEISSSSYTNSANYIHSSKNGGIRMEKIRKRSHATIDLESMSAEELVMGRAASQTELVNTPIQTASDKRPARDLE